MQLAKHHTDVESLRNAATNIAASTQNRERRNKETQGASSPSLSSLPPEIVLELFTFLHGPELVALARTSKQFYSYLQGEYLWQRLCASYGLHDISYFPVRSFRTVYTQLLYPYGSILGLWANDYPYIGSIMQFRLITGSQEEEGGIVGEIWRFSEPGKVTVDGIPLDVSAQPTYFRVLKIELVPSPSSFAHHINGLEEAEVVINCCRHPGIPFDSHPLSLEVAEPSFQAIFLRIHRSTLQHTPFPGPNAPWLDRNRRLPRLKAYPSIAIDQHALVSIYPAIHLPVLFTAPAPNRSGFPTPPALILRCATEACNHLHQAAMAIDDITPFPPSYFPLLPLPNGKARARDDPEFEEKRHLLPFQGMWLAQARHGTECVYIDVAKVTWREGPTYSLCAWKLTGDVCVPRGELGWVVRPGPYCDTQYVGTGTVGERGFVRRRTVNVTMDVLTPDMLKVEWIDQRDVRIYVRYHGVDPSQVVCD